MLGNYYLYRHIRNDVNQPFYIGIGTKPKVFNGHKTEYKRAFDFNKNKRSVFWNNIFSKTKGDISTEILFESCSYDIIKEKEKEFISLYGRRDCCGGILVNLTEGGEGVKGLIITKEQRELLSKRLKGRKHTQEAIEKIKQNHASKQDGYVNIITIEHRQKISETLKGRYKKEHTMCIETGIVFESIRELCNKMFDGKGATKVLQCLSDKYPNKSYNGFHFTKDITNPIVNYPCYFKRVMCINNSKEYKTISDCALELFGDKKYKSGISRALKNNTPYKNYNFKYI